MAVDNVDDLQCRATFVINFTAILECTFSLQDTDDITVGYGSNSFTKTFLFTKGSNQRGRYNDLVTYTVDGGSPSVNTPPSGVSYSGQFDHAPDLSPAVGPRQMQTHDYTFTIDITEPDSQASPPVTGFTGTRLGVNVTIGFEP